MYHVAMCSLRDIETSCLHIEKKMHTKQLNVGLRVNLWIWCAHGYHCLLKVCFDSRHNGKTDGYFPWSRGFEEACMTKLYEFRNNKAQCNGREVQTEGWIQDVIASWAKDFITRKNNEGKEFLLYIPFMTPHLGNADGVRNTWPAIPSLVDKYIAKGLSQGLSQLYAIIEMMDTSVGAVVNHLDSLGLGGDTVVMFFSDNGATGRRLIEDWERRNHIGLSGNKGRVGECSCTQSDCYCSANTAVPAQMKKDLSMLLSIVFSS